MRILISNDDGIHAPGIRLLAQAMAKQAEVYVVAPHQQRSASSHGICLHEAMYAQSVDWGDNITAISFSGTPVDCVKWGIVEFGSEIPFDLVLSGINEGPNLATDVLYSGTVAVAGEAALQGVKAVALSLVGKPPFSFENATKVAVKIANWALGLSLPSDTFLSVNLPPSVNIDTSWVITECGARGFKNIFKKVVDDQGRVCYRHAGEELEELGGESTDVETIRRGEVSITPLRYRFTNQDFLQDLSNQLGNHS